MAISIEISNIKKSVFGNKRIVMADLTFSGSDYPLGGVSLTPGQFDLQEIEFLKVNGKELQYTYDYTNYKLKAYTATGNSPGSTKVLIEAVGSDPSETAPVFVVGYGKG